MTAENGAPAPADAPDEAETDSNARRRRRQAEALRRNLLRRKVQARARGEADVPADIQGDST